MTVLRQSLDSVLGRQVVRNLGAAITHLADVETVEPLIDFGAEYWAPPTSTRALCGVQITDGVVMQEGTKVRCSACRYQGRNR